KNSTAFTQCNARSTPSKRANRSPERSDGRVVTAVRAPDPRVLVIAALLPVAALDGPGDVDRVEPLARLVAVHRRDVHAHGPPVHGLDRLALHFVGHDHVGPARLLEREALG